MALLEAQVVREAVPVKLVVGQALVDKEGVGERLECGLALGLGEELRLAQLEELPVV